VADVERRIYFYKVEMDEPDDWRRAEVLRGLEALSGVDQVIDLGEDNYAWAKVDRIPRGRGAGRLRFFRDRRSNLPGYADNFDVNHLPIPDGAGIVEPTHVVFGGHGLIAAEYNHFAPRITTHLAELLRERLGLDLQIGTYVQGDILEQLDRLSYIQLAEFSFVPTPELESEILNANPIAEAAASLARVEGGRRVYLRLSGNPDNPAWTDHVRAFARRLLNVAGHDTKVLRVRGRDPVSGAIEPVDLLQQKLTRRVDIERPSARSKVLDRSDAYRHIEEAIADVRHTDLPHAAVVF
jgi:hypothetical protein